jgi:hypothetical protein
VLNESREESNFGRNASVPTWTIAITHHETAERPGSSDAIVPWCSRRPPNGRRLENAQLMCAPRSDAVH